MIWHSTQYNVWYGTWFSVACALHGMVWYHGVVYGYYDIVWYTVRCGMVLGIKCGMPNAWYGMVSCCMEWCSCILVRLMWVKEFVLIVFYKVAIYTAAIVEQYEDAILVYLKYLVFFIRMPVYLSVFVLLSSLGLCCCLPFFIHMTSVEHYELPFFFLFCCCCWLIQYWSG